MMNESSRESATRGAHGAGIDWIGLVAIDDAFVRFVSFRFVRSFVARARSRRKSWGDDIERGHRGCVYRLIGCASSSRDHGGVG